MPIAHDGAALLHALQQPVDRSLAGETDAGRHLLEAGGIAAVGTLIAGDEIQQLPLLRGQAGVMSQMTVPELTTSPTAAESPATVPDW